MDQQHAPEQGPAAPLAVVQRGLHHLQQRLHRQQRQWQQQQVGQEQGAGQHHPLLGWVAQAAQGVQQGLQRGLQQGVHHLHQHHLQQQQQQQERPALPWHPMLASITLGRRRQQQQEQQGVGSSSSSIGSSSVSNVLADLAMAKDDVKARLAPIPVYTVANPKNEFVLVAGENNTQLGFFFLNRDDAEAIVEKIREENPRLARDSKILRVTMDNVYEVFTTPREQTGLQGIHFRFMPDMRQVSHALELYREAGVPTRSFVGVPVFQAEGLTVTTQEMQYVPLFLNKEDLGVAVQSAYKQRNATQIKLYRDKAKKHEEEYSQVAVQANSATGREKASLESKAAKAKAKFDAAREKAEAVERAPLPKVEVGSFEEVMMRMTGSSGSELAAWSQVMFVAPGLLQNAVLKE